MLSPPLRLTEHECYDPRLEIKYLLPPAAVAGVRIFLQSRFRTRSFNRTVSHVHSVYLDTPSLQRIEHSLAGIPRRNKLRLRWYDSSLPEKQFYLELKEKIGLLSRKERCCLQMASKSFDQDTDFHPRDIIRIVPENLATTLTSGSSPVVLIHYKREHFQAVQFPMRLTLDYSLKCSRVHLLAPFKPIGKGVSFGCPILEVKTSPQYMDEAHQLLSPLKLRKGRYSKYLQGCRIYGPILGKMAAMVEQDGI